MIVKDKQETLDRASIISNKVIEFLINEMKNFNLDDDPAEYIYLWIHTIASIFAKLCVSLDGYGKIYVIPNLDINKIYEWVNLITKEYIELNKDFLDIQKISH